MKTVIIKVNNTEKTIAEHQVVTKDGQPTVIKATNQVNYELVDKAIGRAPDHIITKRVGKDLHVSIEDEGQESDLIIEGYYNQPDSALIGLAEDGEYYYYVPDTGEVADYVTELEAGDVEGQALGGESQVAPWWMGAVDGGFNALPWLVGLAGLGIVGAALADSDSSSNNTVPPIVDTTAPDRPSVDPVNESAPITGTGVAGDTITVTFPDSSTADTVVDDNGNWSVPNPGLNPGDKVTATATDKAGNVSSPADQIVIDNTAPDAPHINPINESAPITGVGNPGDTITVTFPDGSTTETVVGEDGKWEVANPGLTPGDTVTATATDPAGNISQPDSEPVVDDIAPERPSVDPVNESSSITGTGMAGDTITVTFPDGSTAETVVDGKGNWSVPNPGLTPGDKVTATATDKAGNVSSPADQIVIDNTAPDAPHINPINESDPITGVGNPGDTITVTYPDGTTAETVVDKDGKWEVANPGLTPGDTVTATATDPAGNISQPDSEPVVDNTAPDRPSVDPVNESSPITGTGVAGDTITVTFPDGTAAETVVGEDGKWEVANPGLTPGDKVTATATDKAGNVSSPADQIVTDTIAPSESAPTVSFEDAGEDGVYSKDEVGEDGTITATVKVPEGTVIGDIITIDGIDYPVTQDILTNGKAVEVTPGDTITASVKDKAGNTTPPVTATAPAADAALPTAPSVVIQDDADIVIAN